MSNQLPPCPFCGAKLRVIGESDALPVNAERALHPENSECLLSNFAIYLNVMGAVDAWSRRAAQPAAGEPVYQLRNTVVGNVWRDADKEAYDSAAKLAEYERRILWTAPPAAAHGDGLSFSTVDELAEAIRQVAAYEDLGPELIAEEMFKQAGVAEAAHGDELVAVVGTVPDGSGFKSLDFKVELQSLPDGTRLYAAHGDEAVRRDAEPWQPLTRAGQIQPGDRLCFTVAGKEVVAIAQEVLDPGNPDLEEVVYHTAKNHFFITRMAVEGTSSAKDVRFIAMRAQAGEGGEV